MSVDPVAADGSTGANFNRYKYAANNPYRFIDPDGRVDWDMLGDSFKLEGGISFGLEAKARLGPAKGSLGIGSVTFLAGGVTAQPDAYFFQEVSSWSAGIEVFKDYGVGLKGSSQRSYVGREGKLQSDEVVKGGGMLGRKRSELSVEDGGTNAEISVEATVLVGKLHGSVDLGKAVKAILSPGGNGGKPASGGFQGVYRVEGRIDSKRLDKELRGK